MGGDGGNIITRAMPWLRKESCRQFLWRERASTTASMASTLVAADVVDNRVKREELFYPPRGGSIRGFIGLRSIGRSFDPLVSQCQTFFSLT